MTCTIFWATFRVTLFSEAAGYYRERARSPAEIVAGERNVTLAIHWA